MNEAHAERFILQFLYCTMSEFYIFFCITDVGLLFNLQTVLCSACFIGLHYIILIIQINIQIACAFTM